jgi:hypothetical protein
MGGEYPYKDYFSNYAPGQFYIIALLFSIFGDNLITARLYDIACRLMIIVLVYVVATKILKKSLALTAAISALLLLSKPYFYTYAVFASLVFCLLAILCLMQYLDKEQKRVLFLSGIFAGMAATIRQDIGGYVAIASCIAISIYAFIPRNQEDSTNSISRVGRAIGLFCAGVMLVALPIYGYFIYEAGFDAMWDQLIAFPAVNMREFRHYPYYSSLRSTIDRIPDMRVLDIQTVRMVIRDSLYLVFPLILYPVACVYVIRSFMKVGGVYLKRNYGAVALTIFGILLILQAYNRPDYIHLLPTSLIAFLLLAYVLSFVCENTAALKGRIAAAWMMIPFVMIYFYSPVKTTMEYVGKYVPLISHSELNKAAGVYISQDQEQAVKFIATHTEKQEPIYVGNSRHDLISVNDIGFY